MAQTPEKTPDDALADLAEQIVAVDPDAVISHQIAFGELSLTVTAGRIVGLVKRLRDHPALLFTTLVDICAVDHPGREKRFDVVYHFLSMRQNHRVRLRAPIREDETIPSVTPLFPAANWFERETFDMHGVIFTGHPDLRRLLTDYGFQGFPLRKDFPTTGYTEVRYDEAAKRVIYEPVSLVQEYRRFDFMSPWEGAEYILPGDEKTSAG